MQERGEGLHPGGLQALYLPVLKTEEGAESATDTDGLIGGEILHV